MQPTVFLSHSCDLGLKWPNCDAKTLLSVKSGASQTTESEIQSHEQRDYGSFVHNRKLCLFPAVVSRGDVVLTARKASNTASTGCFLARILAPSGCLSIPSLSCASACPLSTAGTSVTPSFQFPAHNTFLARIPRKKGQMASIISPKK